jgi:glycosyltransferase involved in cell wall biosynthesis
MTKEIIFNSATLTPHMVYSGIMHNPPEGYTYSIPKISLPIRVIKKVFAPDVATNIQLNNLPVHSCQKIMLSKNPYVVDCEHAIGFTTNFRNHRLLSKLGFKKFVTKHLLKDHCKKILPFSYATQDSLIQFFGKELLFKMEVMYPAIRPVNIIKKKNDKLHLLYVGTKFYCKGGPVVLEVFERLSKKYDIVLDFIGPIPDDYKEVYNGNKRLRHQTRVSDAELKRLYTQADMFLLPLFQASFGVYLEAMTYQVPVITTDIYDIPEIIEDYKTGVLVHSPISMYGDGFISKWGNRDEFIEAINKTDKKQFINDFTNKTEELINSEELRMEIQRNQKITIESGKFSITHRNKQLKRIYDNAFN